MALARLLRHLAMTPWHLRRAFPPGSLRSIEAAVRAGEAHHAGELRFVVEAALDARPLWAGQTARERAIDLFSRLRIWDTEHNSGVLVYVLLADRRVEIVADRGIDARTGTTGWTAICRDMEGKFATGNFGAGAVLGIEAISRLLATHFPVQAHDRNELPDTPVLL